MANPRIEEVDDDEPDEVEIDDEMFDFARPQQGGLQSAVDSSTSQMTPEALSAMLQPQQGSAFQQQQRLPEKERLQREREARERSKTYQCIYPVYFDAARSRENGRRVSKEDAVSNPLARDIVDAVQHIGNSKGVPLHIVFEPDKGHPKDWGNPGRVRVLVKQNGKPVSAKIANKHHLYKLIADYLKQHPTTKESAMKYRFGGMPPQKEPPPPPAIPRGFKIGTILPLHSPALSGGGVSDNFLKDMMSEMGGQLPPGMEGMLGGAGGGGGSGGQPKKVKDKKKK